MEKKQKNDLYPGLIIYNKYKLIHQIERETNIYLGKYYLFINNLFSYQRINLWKSHFKILDWNTKLQIKYKPKRLSL